MGDPESSTAGPKRSKPLVLVADDDEDLRNLAGLQLAPDFDVITAESGPECIRLAGERQPDVILLDVMMPGMDGRDALVLLSEDDRTRQIPVIFLSALGRPEDRISGLESGAIDYITKPADPRELAARVASAMRRRPAANPPISVTTPDREQFETRLAEEQSRARRSNAPLSILLMDVDDMMGINERVGRDGGDRVLEEMAGALRTTLRLSDALFRIGGDEFAVVLPDTAIGTAFYAAQRCREALLEVSPGGRPVRVSVGIAEQSPQRTTEELIAAARMALEHAQESGGDRAWRADDPRRYGISPTSLSRELTEREWDVLAHLVNRRTEQEIANRLGISAGTVRSHKARIRRKLQVPSNIRLGDFARSNLKELVGQLSQPQNRA